LADAAAVIRAGGVVAYPVEHFYALACDPWNPAAVARLFAAKGRPEHKPLLLAVTADGLPRVTAGVPAAARALVSAWPAGLTLVVPAAPSLPEAITAGTGTVGVRRIPAGAAPVAEALLNLCGGALPATSANRSGEDATGDPQPVAQLAGVDLLLDAGVLPAGDRSTLVDVTGTPWRLLRAGACPAERVACWGALEGSEGEHVYRNR